jgi:hypothetical protein
MTNDELLAILNKIADNDLSDKSAAALARSALATMMVLEKEPIGMVTPVRMMVSKSKASERLE